MLLIAACSPSAGSASPSPSPSPSHAAPEQIEVPTQGAVATLDPGATAAACGAALLEGELVRDQSWGLAVRDDDGIVHMVIWPSGYYGVDEGAGMLLDQHDRTVARVGDRVRMEGGEAADGRWIVCPDKVTVRP